VSVKQLIFDSNVKTLRLNAVNNHQF